MDPPWRRYPDIPAGSIGWRMGPGEDYYFEFYRWFSGLSNAEKAAYSEANQPPSGWQDLYKIIIEDPWVFSRGSGRSWSPKDSEGWDSWD